MGKKYIQGRAVTYICGAVFCLIAILKEIEQDCIAMEANRWPCKNQ